MKNFYLHVFFQIILLSISFILKGQDENTIFWRGRVVNGDTGEPVPNAVIAVYSKTILYSADIEGIVRLRLQKNDSIRVVVLGYSAETFRISNLQIDSTGHAIMKIYPVSYLLKEVKVLAHKGILNPVIFPKFEDDEPKIDMKLPGDIGSRMSKESPSEQLLFEDSKGFHISEMLLAVMYPVSYAYSKFSKEEKSIRKLREARYHQSNEERLKDYISPEAIGIITGYKGEELLKFFIFCNANLVITHNDTGASITTKIEDIFKKYQKEL